jgi:hypothetical protein
MMNNTDKGNKEGGRNYWSTSQRMDMLLPTKPQSKREDVIEYMDMMFLEVCQIELTFRVETMNGNVLIHLFSIGLE